MFQTASAILMVRPAAFGFNAETSENNVFQQQIALGKNAVAQKAIEEFDAAVSKLRQHQIAVTVIEDTPSPLKPDAVFPNNWFGSLSGKLFVFPMFAANRRIEKRDDILQQLCANFDVKDVEDWSEYEADNFFLEGTGSMIFDHENKIVYACLSPRTHKALFEKFAKAQGYKPVYFLSRDEKKIPIYHTNVMMHIGESYTVVGLDSIEGKAERIFIEQMLAETGHEVIPISFAQIRHFAGNMIQVRSTSGDKYTILSQSAFRSLTKEQKHILSVHTQLLPINIPTIETVGGGSARCMVAELFLDRKNS